MEQAKNEYSGKIIRKNISNVVPGNWHKNGFNSMTKEDKLAEILKKLEDVKSEFADVVDEFDTDYADDSVMDLLVEAASALDDAIDCIIDTQEL